MPAAQSLVGRPEAAQRAWNPHVAQGVLVKPSHEARVQEDVFPARVEGGHLAMAQGEGEGNR